MIWRSVGASGGYSLEKGCAASLALRYCRAVAQGKVIQCGELAGKVVRDCSIYEDGSDGPEVLIEFTDDTTFSVSLKTIVAVEAKCIRDDGGQPQVIRRSRMRQPCRPLSSSPRF